MRPGRRCTGVTPGAGWMAGTALAEGADSAGGAAAGNHRHPHPCTAARAGPGPGDSTGHPPASISAALLCMLSFNRNFKMSGAGKEKEGEIIIACMSLFYNVFMWEWQGGPEASLCIWFEMPFFFSINRKVSEGEC